MTSLRHIYPSMPCSAPILSQSFRRHHATNRSELDVDRNVDSQETKVQPDAAELSLKGIVHPNWDSAIFWWRLWWRFLSVLEEACGGDLTCPQDQKKTFRLCEVTWLPFSRFSFPFSVFWTFVTSVPDFQLCPVFRARSSALFDKWETATCCVCGRCSSL